MWVEVCVCVCELVWGFVCVCSVWKYLVGYSSQKKISQIVFLHQDTPSQPFIYSRIRLSSIASTPNSICRIRTGSRPFSKVMFSIVLQTKQIIWYFFIIISAESCQHYDAINSYSSTSQSQHRIFSTLKR